MSKQIMNFEEKISALKSKISDLEQKLIDLETQRRLAILDRDSEAKEIIRKRHIDVSFELLQTKDKVRELGRKKRELENAAVSDAKIKEAQELQAIRDKIFEQNKPAFKRIKKLRGRLSNV